MCFAKLCHSLLIFFLRRGHTINQTTRAVTRAQPSEMLSVPHHGTRLKPSTVHTRQSGQQTQIRNTTAFFNYSEMKLFLDKAGKENVSRFTSCSRIKPKSINEGRDKMRLSYFFNITCFISCCASWKMKPNVSMECSSMLSQTTLSALVHTPLIRYWGRRPCRTVILYSEYTTVSKETQSNWKVATLTVKTR